MHVKLLTFISLKKATTIWVSLLFSFLFWNFRREFLPRSKIWIKMVSLPSIKQKKKLLIVIFLLILNFRSFSKFFPSPLHQIFYWNIKNMTEELHSIKNVSNRNTNQTMTANCQNLTSYSRKHQHLLNDFVNRDGINYTNNLCQH